MTPMPDYAAIVGASPYPYLIFAPDFTIIGVNDAYVRATGKTREELLGRITFTAFAPEETDPQSIEKVRRSLERVLATRAPDSIALARFENARRQRGPAGVSQRYWSIIHTPILDAGGNVTCIVHNPIDITELYLRNKTAAGQAVPEDVRFHAEGNLFHRAQALEAANRVLGDELANLRRLFAQAPGFVAVLRGPQHIFELANEAYYELVGRRDLIGRPFLEAIPDLGGRLYAEVMDRAYASGDTFVGHGMKAVLQRAQDGPPAEIHIDLVVQPVTAPDGSVTRLFVQGHDITAQKRAQDDLRISNERWKLAIEGTGDGVWDWNVQTGDVSYSRRWKELLGYAPDEIGSTLDEWRSRLHPDDAALAAASLQDCLTGKTASYTNEHRLRCKDGGWKWMQARGIVVARDDQGRPLRMTGTMTDISAKKESEERVWHHANFDPLTGLPNRRLFRDRLDREVAKAHRAGLQMALLFIDLDRFKEVNDLLGHDAGDALLTEAARRLRACVRESDTVARLGGDEFTVILADLDSRAHVEQIAQKLLAALAEPFRLGNEVAYLSGSVGITMYPADGGAPEDLIRNADQAMYAAKNAGRNQFSFFTRSMQEQAHLRLRLAGDLRHALGAGQLQVHYQPVVDLRSGRIAKAEALLRWQHPAMGLVEPSQFIPLAEESGLINEIGEWVFRQAAAYSQRWSAQLGAPFSISVNKSPVQFLSQAKEPGWSRHLQNLGLPGNSITVEITEGLLLNASTAVSDKLLEYRDAGIQVAIDDFGTGYSSMAYLKKFDIDYLKIDQSFVRDIAADDSDRAIAESMIVMAHRLGLKVIAEGIETAEQERLLMAAGCDFGQGYLYAPAAPPDDFERMLAQDGKTASGLAH